MCMYYAPKKKKKTMPRYISPLTLAIEYNLKPNDVVYVEPNKVKVAISGRSQQVLPLILTGASILVLVIDRVIK